MLFRSTIDGRSTSKVPGSVGPTKKSLIANPRIQDGVEQIDEQVGGLIADFRARSEKAGRPWVIVLTSDHGEMLGDHGYFRKCEPYEGSANIPLIIAASLWLVLSERRTKAAKLGP